MMNVFHQASSYGDRIPIPTRLHEDVPFLFPSCYIVPLWPVSPGSSFPDCRTTLPNGGDPLHHAFRVVPLPRRLRGRGGRYRVTMFWFSGGGCSDGGQTRSVG